MATSRQHRAAVYVRVSTHDQEVENQLGELRKYVEARGWEAREYVDEGVSGAVERSGPRNLDSGLSEISIVFQAAVPKPVAPKYTTSGVRRPSEL